LALIELNHETAVCSGDREAVDVPIPALWFSGHQARNARSTGAATLPSRFRYRLPEMRAAGRRPQRYPNR